VLVWRTTRYELTTKRLRLRTGIIARNGRDIPLSRVTDVSFRKSLLDQILGCGTLVVESAGEHGEITLTEIPHVERVSATLFQLVEDERLRAAQIPQAGRGDQDDAGGRHGATPLPWLYDLLMTRVLLAEDDTSISEPLSRALRREGYQVEITEDGPATLGRALSDGIDLILLDIGLPELDGLEVCRRVRAEGNGVPVLILTARADEVDTVVGLDAGADDYVTKPFRLAELLARVRALLRRGTAEVPGTVRGVRVDAEARRAWHGDIELDLTTKEFDLLWILLRDAGKVVTREQIMREVWDAKWWTSTKTLDMHISWLRRKLGDDAHHPMFITTVRGVGFRFERGD
jgi:DNA-binding response OmpR family regulator